jgi:hypothetical protein
MPSQYAIAGDGPAHDRRRLGAMDEATTRTLSDEDMATVMPGAASTLEERPRDEDGTDAQDADGTDSQDADGTDGDAKDMQDGDSTDTQDADGTDSTDADGVDQPS